MLPINNSDTAWLIVADFNQENDKSHEELRKDVISPDVNQWVYENGMHQVGVGEIQVGDSLVGDKQFIVGDDHSRVGCDTSIVAGDYSMYGDLVGGNFHQT